MNKLIDYVKTNWIEVSVFGSLFLLIFVLPSLAYPNGATDPTGLLTVFHILTFLILAVYIFFLARGFIRKNKGEKLSENQTLVNVSGSIFSIVIGLGVGFILMLIVSFPEAFQGIFIIVQGGFRNIKSIGDMIYFSVPFIFTGLAVAFAFRTGLFNIGATGQFTVGATVAVYIGYKYSGLGEISPLLHWGTAILAAIIAGAIWGSVPGILKAYRNVNEVVTAIMMNYVGMYLSILIINNYMFNASTAAAHYVLPTSYTPTLGLGKFFTGSDIDGSIVIAIIVVAILHIVLNKTTFGFELKAVGHNRDAAKYAGMNAKRNIVLSMIISGAIAGLAGGLMYLAPGIRLPASAILSGEGFTGIAISLLGLSTPIGVLLAGLFYGSLKIGGFYLQLLTFTPEIIDIIIAVIIYASALSLILRNVVTTRLKAREMALVNQEGDTSEEIKDKPPVKQAQDEERSDE